jgi:hypothetical protein
MATAALLGNALVKPKTDAFLSKLLVVKHVGMTKLLEHVLRGHTDEPRAHAVFGHATDDPHDEPPIVRRTLQRYLSGVCFIDDENSTSRLFTNAHALYPLPRRLKTQLSELKPPFH